MADTVHRTVCESNEDRIKPAAVLNKSQNLIIRSACLLGKEGDWIIVITEGVYSSITPSKSFNAKHLILADYFMINAGGKLVIPGLVDAHVHLDKCYLLDRCYASTGDFKEAMTETAAAKRNFCAEDVRNRAQRLIENQISFGTTLMRAHVEVDSIVQHTSLDTILTLKEEYSDAITIQVAVFAQEGITNRADQIDLMRSALRRKGCTVVGSAPYCDPDPEGNITAVFDLAVEFNVDVDFHLDYFLDGQQSHLQFVIAETIRRGWQGRVALGHMTHMSVHSEEGLALIAGQLKAADIYVIALPSSDLVMMGRADDGNRRRGVCPVDRLRSMGVTATVATNNIQNLFNFSGDGDLLKICTLLCQVLQITSESGALQCVEMATRVGAKALGVQHSIEVGNRADFIIIGADECCHTVIEDGHAMRGTDKTDTFHSQEYSSSVQRSASFLKTPSPSLKLLSCPPVERIVFKNGRIVSETVSKRTLFRY